MTSLKLQFADDFDREFEPPEHFDLTRWTRWQGDVRTENGRAVLTSMPPGDIGLVGIITRNKYGNPGLAGTNGAEASLVKFTDRGDDSAAGAAMGASRLVQGWCLTLGNSQGQLSHWEKNDRAVQLHFDLIRPNGLFLYLVRGLVPEDFDKYPRDGYGPGGPTDISKEERRQLHEDLVAKAGEVFISRPVLSLSHRVYRSEQEIQDMIGRPRRWGLYLTDDANTVYWTLDGQVMDSADITGYFSSSPEAVGKEALLSVIGVGGGERSTWKMDDLEIYVSP